MSYQKKHGDVLLMLNLGCGDHTHESWINIDYSLKARLKELWILRPFIQSRNPPGYLNHDLRRGIPFKEGSVDVVYSSHVLEHMKKSYALQYLQEMHRVLKPGGVARIVVPDLEFGAKEYLKALDELRQGDVSDQDLVDRHEWATILLLDQMVRTRSGGEMVEWLVSHRESSLVQNSEGVLKEIASSREGPARIRILRRIAQLSGLSNPARTGELHRWMYDDISLGELMKKAGFSDVKRMSHTESRIPGWENYYLDNNPDTSAYMPGSIWIEAIR
jgi:SAM-dependent methyltransferase